MDNLDVAYSEFWEELLLQADSTGELQATAFFEIFASIAAENGDCGDLEYSHARKDGPNAYQVDGYVIDVDRGELVLAASDFRDSREIESLNAANLQSAFRKVERFFDLSLSADFVAQLEETSNDFQVAYTILSNADHIKRVKFIIFSNAQLTARKKQVDTKTKDGRHLNYSVLDLTRYVDIINSRTGIEPIEIDLQELNNGSPVPCIKAYSGSDEYESYLVAVPGVLLAEIYGAYGARLLEQNVRTFLQARTKVNKGIIHTIGHAPGMFFAYNNGLTATALGIETRRMEDGGIGIVSISDFQIVNGGQTTASILYARDRGGAELSKVFVQMKLSVVKPENVGDVVPKISRFANTQNRISESDFFASHPFHLEMEKISRRLNAPPREGLLHGSRWFYERARGQYKDKQVYMKESERKKFQLRYPKDQVIVKTDVSKYELTFGCAPHTVSQGAQKAFLSFAEQISKRWEKDETEFNEGYFRDMVTRAMVFRWTDHMIATSDWYKNDRGYKAQIVTYTVAWLVDRIRTRFSSEIDLRDIWNHQGLPAPLISALSDAAPIVAQVIKDAPESIRNISEYAKQQVCWSQVQNRVELALTDDIKSCVVNRTEVHQKKKDDRNVKKIDDEIDLDIRLMNIAPHADLIRKAGTANQLISPDSDRAIKKLASGNVNLTRSEKNAVNLLLSRLEDIGIEIPGG